VFCSNPGAAAAAAAAANTVSWVARTRSAELPKANAALAGRAHLQRSFGLQPLRRLSIRSALVRRGDGPVGCFDAALAEMDSGCARWRHRRARAAAAAVPEQSARCRLLSMAAQTGPYEATLRTYYAVPQRNDDNDRSAETNVSVRTAPELQYNYNAFYVKRPRIRAWMLSKGLAPSSVHAADRPSRRARTPARRAAFVPAYIYASLLNKLAASARLRLPSCR